MWITSTAPAWARAPEPQIIGCQAARSQRELHAHDCSRYAVAQAGQPHRLLHVVMVLKPLQLPEIIESAGRKTVGQLHDYIYIGIDPRLITRDRSEQRCADHSDSLSAPVQSRAVSLWPVRGSLLYSCLSRSVRSRTASSLRSVRSSRFAKLRSSLP